jgi:hypothetical protein
MLRKNYPCAYPVFSKYKKSASTWQVWLVFMLKSEQMKNFPLNS